MSYINGLEVGDEGGGAGHDAARALVEGREALLRPLRLRRRQLWQRPYCKIIVLLLNYYKTKVKNGVMCRPSSARLAPAVDGCCVVTTYYIIKIMYNNIIAAARARRHAADYVV